MRNRLMPLVALMSLLPVAALAAGNAADPPTPPPTDAGPASEPDDPNAAPYPPDGVTDPNAEYPTDGTEGTDQGEAVPPDAHTAAAAAAARRRPELIGQSRLRH